MVSDEVVVIFDGTDQEGAEPRTNMFKFGLRFSGTAVLYEPGIGTWQSGNLARLLHWPASMLGTGLVQRVDDMLDRLEFYSGCQVSVVGGSRGAAQALELCWQYEERYGASVRFCGLYDTCKAHHAGALKRVLPRGLWGGRKVHERPPADVVVHATAGLEPNRFYAHDTVRSCDHEWVFSGLEHGQVLRHPCSQAWLEGHAADAGLPMALLST